jgi:Zn-dependent protease with chaperone function
VVDRQREEDDRRWARTVLTDPAVLPSPTTLRFAVLVLLVAATTSSIYFHLAVLAHSEVDVRVRICLAGVSPRGLARGDLWPAGRALDCAGPFTPTLIGWALSGIAMVAVLSALSYWLTPIWIRRFTRGWLPFLRTQDGRRWRWARPWWIPLGRQRMRPLVRTDPVEAGVASRVEYLAGQLGLTIVPVCLLNPYVPDTNARAFGSGRRGYLQLNDGLPYAYLRQRDVFDAVVLHELGHLRNRDLRPSYLTLAVWRAFLLAALVPYLVSAVAPGLVEHPLGPYDALRLALPDLHVAGAVVGLTTLVFLTYRSVLRIRETHADATAAVVDLAVVHAAMQRRLETGAERSRLEFIDDHPRLWRRARDLLDPRRLAPPETLTHFGAGLAIALITVNLWVFGWTALLTRVPYVHRLALDLVSPVGASAAEGVLFIVLVFAPGAIVSLAVVVRLAQLTTWRTRLASPDGRTPATWRAALAMTAGLLLGEPLSVLYADAGLWGYSDISPGWTLADVASSAAVLAAVMLVVFRLSAESATIRIPTARSVRRACSWATAVITLGALPAYFTWTAAHSSGYISRFYESRVSPPLDTWFGTSFMFTTYNPLVLLLALPGAGLLFGLSVSMVAWVRRRPQDQPPAWLASSLHALTPRLRAAATAVPLPRVLAAGLGAAAGATLVGTAITLFTRHQVGATAMSRAVGSGAVAVMQEWLIWTVAGGTSIVALILAGRSSIRLTTALLTMFVSTTWAGALMPIPLVLGACGGSAYECARAHPDIMLALFGQLTAITPVEGPILLCAAAGLTAVVLAALRRRQRPAGPVRRGNRAATVLLIATLVLSVAGTVAFVWRILLRS